MNSVGKSSFKQLTPEFVAKMEDQLALQQALLHWTERVSQGHAQNAAAKNSASLPGFRTRPKDHTVWPCKVRDAIVNQIKSLEKKKG